MINTYIDNNKIVSYISILVTSCACTPTDLLLHVKAMVLNSTIIYEHAFIEIVLYILFQNQLFLSKHYFFQEYHERFKQFGSRSGSTLWIQMFANHMCLAARECMLFLLIILLCYTLHSKNCVRVSVRLSICTSIRPSVRPSAYRFHSLLGAFFNQLSSNLV